MVNRNLIRTLEDDNISAEFDDLFTEDWEAVYEPPEGAELPKFDVNEIVEGKIVRVDSEAVVVDVGFKSEGTISRSEWEEHH